MSASIKVSATPGLNKYIDAVLARKRKEVAAEVAGVFTEELLAHTPVQSGHAHEAWIAAARQVEKKLDGNTSTLSTAIAAHADKGSGDPKAKRSGKGRVRNQKQVTTITFSNLLDFVSVLEYGGSIRPIQPGGFKVGKHHYPGPLFGKRRPVTSGNNRGWLAWRDASGEVKFSRHSTFSAGHYAGNALKEAERRVSQ